MRLLLDLTEEVKAAREALDNLDNYGVRFHHHRDLDTIRALLNKLALLDRTRENNETRCECKPFNLGGVMLAGRQCQPCLNRDLEHLRDSGAGEDGAGQPG